MCTRLFYYIITTIKIPAVDAIKNEVIELLLPGVFFHVFLNGNLQAALDQNKK